LAGIALSHIAKNFGPVEVINDLSLEIRSGEFIVFLGPSGCGKSTLLRMIAGLEEITRGDILIDGVRVNDLPPGRRGVAMVFQHYALYPHMTTRQNMAFGLKNIGMKSAEIEQKIQAAARILEMEGLLERKPSQLSGGQRQRVAIGRAIVKNPQAFLFDEPLSNLDAALRARTRVELARLHQKVQATMVFVTHDQIEAMTLADRIVVMDQGRIEQVGTPIEVYRTPATRFVAGFIGTPAMNFLPARVLGERDGNAVVQLGNGAEVLTRVRAATLPADGISELGVRAEHVQLGGDTKAEAEVVEHLGERTLIHARLSDGATLVCEDSGDSLVKVGDPISLAIPGASVHLFDAQGRAQRGA
jgi:multiple sugar transport system ATP-binding protein